MTENLKFDWQTSIIAKPEQTEQGTLVISGELVNGDVCANNFALDINELPKIASQIKDATLRLDHSKSARDVIGGFRLGTYEKDKNRVMFEAEVDDPNIQRSILKGRLKYISIGASADMECSICGQPTRPFRKCKCKGSHDVVKNIHMKEASIVTEPAYANSSFSPQGFVASITAAIADLVTPKSSNEDEAGPFVKENKIGEKNMTNETEVQATTLKPAGPDAVVLLAEKLEALTASFTKMEQAMVKKQEEEEAKKKDAVINKLEALMTKLEKATEKTEAIPKEVPKSEFGDEDKAKKTEKAKKEPPTPVEEDEEEEEETEECKKAKKKEAKGAKVEDANGQVNLTAQAVPNWFGEIRAFAEKNGILN